MNDSLLTNMEQAGSIVTFTDPKPADRDKIAAQFTALRGAKHAIISDETVGDDHVMIRVFHYKTCYRCLEILVEKTEKKNA
jgi:hypothetical protein